MHRGQSYGREVAAWPNWWGVHQRKSKEAQGVRKMHGHWSIAERKRQKKRKRKVTPL